MSNTFDYEKAVELVRSTLAEARSTFREGKRHAYERAIRHKEDEKAGWALEAILENTEAAERNHSPLCDDTGVPHLMLEVGPDVFVIGRMLNAIRDRIANGLRELPGCPMGIMGDGNRRIDQSGGLDPDLAGVEPAPVLLRTYGGSVVRLHVMVFGDGPAIRTKAYRVLHKRNTRVVIDEIVKWATEGVTQLGCSPCTLAVGIGRSHSRVASMMLQVQADGCYDVRSEIEAEITRRANESDVGPLGLHGRTSVIAAFVKVDSQRTSDVRIVCVGPVCCFESRIATIGLV